MRKDPPQSYRNESNARNPKRHRPTTYGDFPAHFDRNHNIEEANEAHYKPPSPRKKQRRGRRNPSVRVDGELAQELKEQGTRNESSHAYVNVNTKPKESRSPKQSKSQSLLMNELVIVSERSEISDAQAASEGNLDVPISTIYCNWDLGYCESELVPSYSSRLKEWKFACFLVTRMEGVDLYIKPLCSLDHKNCDSYIAFLAHLNAANVSFPEHKADSGSRPNRIA